MTNLTPDKNDRGITEQDDVVTKALEKGYAISKYAREDLARDNRNVVRKGGAYDLQSEQIWGAIGVWPWGYQLVINAFDQMDRIDLDRIVTTGHSRGGKTALAVAIFDERVAIAGSNSSGLGATASARIFEEGHPRIRLTVQQLDSQMLAIFDSLRLHDDEFRHEFQEQLRQATNLEFAHTCEADANLKERHTEVVRLQPNPRNHLFELQAR